MFKPACFWIAPLAAVLATATLSHGDLRINAVETQ